MKEDIDRFGNQHTEFVDYPKQELQIGLKELEDNPVFRQRFQDFVTPMVFNTVPHDFDTCFASFKRIAQSLIKTIYPIWEPLMPHTKINQDPLYQEQVNKAVWAACDTFRGTVDPSIYKYWSAPVRLDT